MTTPTEVVAAARGMMSGSRVERARAGVKAFGLFNDLDAADKRDLAVLVAQRAAPELVPRIQAEGGVDLTEDQSRAVLDMVRRLDGDDLLELQEVVSSDEGRRRAMSSVGSAAAAATGFDDVIGTPGDGEPSAGRPSAEEPDEPVLDEAAERATFRLEALQRQSDELRDALAEEEQAHRDAVSAREAAEREVEGLRVQLAEEAERADGQARKAEQARSEMRAAEERLRRTRHRATADVNAPSGDVPAAAASDGTPLPVIPVSTSADEVEALVARLRDVRPSEALRVLTLAAPSVAGSDAAGRRRMLEAVPDGWARQRGLQRLVEAEAVPANEATDLLALLGSTGSQVFAAGSMLATGLVRTDDLVDVLEPAALARLRRRAPV